MGSDQIFRTAGLMLVLAAGAAAAAYDANDVKLGATERDIKQRFPNAHCRELEWPSRAAERRCDDSRITFYVKKNSVEGFDVRFDQREVDRVVKYLRARYGEPESEIGLPYKPEAPAKVEWQGKH